MKHIFSLFFLLIYAESSSAQLNVWRWQNPLPEGDLLHAVQMFSSANVYACGDNGSFMRTSDSGATWEVQTNLLKLKTSFNALSFFDQNYGMICGDSGRILKTTDGGTSWNLQNLSKQNKLNGIVVIDKNISIAVALGGNIMRSTDGGNSWTLLPIEFNYNLYGINKLRSDFLTITGYAGTFLKSVDSGRSWVKIETGFGNTFYCGRFSDDMTATIIGDNGLIIHTSDGGKSWKQQRLADSTNPITASLNYVDSRDPNIFGMVGDYGTIVYTTNGGTDWIRSYIGTNDHIKGISFFDKLTATAVGRDGVVLRTTDGGVTWKYQPFKPTTVLLRAVAFPKGDTSLGIAVGEIGTIMRTTNGGKDWVVIPSGFSHTLRGICFIDAINAIAVGDYGTILKSTDAGLTWIAQQSSTAENLYSVSFATPNDGLAVGDNNTVLKTYSAGEFWTREYIKTPSRPPWLLPIDFLNSVSYPDVSHAFVTGFHAYYFSSDGGINWKFTVIDPQDTGIQIVNSGKDTGVFPVDVFRGISFADSLHGAIIHSYGPDGAQVVYWYIRFTSDGGSTWNIVSTPNNTYLNSIQCVDTTHATVVGGGGYVAHTSDGGITVNPQKSNTLNNLYGVSFGSLKAGTAVGNRGNIIRITTNEAPSSVSEHEPSGTPKIIIDGNYPNPFSGVTTISYNLPEAGLTTIEIFSVNGQHISQLANKYESSGDHSILFNAAGLASGTYLCQINSAGMIAIAKLRVEN